MLKRWSLPIVLTYLVALTIGSLSNVGRIPKLGFSFDDKIYHFLAYATLTVLLFNYIRTTNLNRKILISAVVSIVYGIIIEALQLMLTDFRTPDYYDVIANTTGVLIAVVFLMKFKEKLKLK